MNIRHYYEETFKDLNDPFGHFVATTMRKFSKKK